MKLKIAFIVLGLFGVHGSRTTSMSASIPLAITTQRAAGKFLFKLGYTAPTYSAYMDKKLLKYSRNLQRQSNFQPNPISFISDCIKNGANVNARNEDDGDTPLHLVIEARQGMSMIGSSSYEGTYPTGDLEKDAENAKWHANIMNRRWEELKEKLDVIKLLLSKGADINAKNDYGQTPLHLARQKEVMETLLSAKNIDIHATDNHGSTVLHDF